MSGVCLVTQVAKTQFFTRLTASGASSIYAAVKLGFWHVILGNWWQFFPRNGGIAEVARRVGRMWRPGRGQSPVELPTNGCSCTQSMRRIQMIRCSFAVKPSWCVISLTHTWDQVWHILPITLWPNATSNISKGKSSLVCASCLHGTFVKKASFGLP